MNNPDLVSGICEQIKTETEVLQKATWNVRNTITEDTRQLFEEIQISSVVHLQNLVMALTKEMTPDEKAEYHEQVNETAEPEEEG